VLCLLTPDYNISVPNIPIGTKGELTILVGDDNAISFLGVDGARILATPYLIRWGPEWMFTTLPLRQWACG
jgi:hypothetical protein